MRYAIVDGNVVTNVVEWDGVQKWDSADRARPVPAGVPVAIGWVHDPERATWQAPGPTLEDALAAVDAHATALLAHGVVVDGVRLSLDTADRLDWLGLLTMRQALLSAAGGAIPVVGVEGGVLVLRSEEQIATVAGQLATHRLFVQALSAGARTQVRAAATAEERGRIVEAFCAVT